MHRFFVPDAEATGDERALPDEEAEHLTRVLRLTAGARVRVFDGRGGEWTAEVSAVGRRRARVRLIDRAPAAPEPRVVLSLAVAVLTGDKMDDVVRDVTMLGVRRLIPTITERTAIAPRAIERSGRIARWRRIAIASAKQCGRARLIEVTDAMPLVSALALASDAPKLMLVEPSAGTASVSMRDVPRAPAATLFVGPEGGWTEGERRDARAAGAVAMTLGGLTLRADAAPLVAVTALRALWEDL